MASASTAPLVVESAIDEATGAASPHFFGLGAKLDLARGGRLTRLADMRLQKFFRMRRKLDQAAWRFTPSSSSIGSD